MLARFVVLLAACWIFGCRSSETEQAPDQKAAARCDDEHARALHEELDSLCPIGLMSTEASVAVPLAPWEPAPTPVPHEATRIEVSPGSVRVAGSRIPDMIDLPGRLRLDREFASSIGRGRMQWVLVIDQATSRADVQAAVKGLMDAGERQGFVLLGTSAVPELPQPRDPAKLSQLVAKVSAHDPSQRAAQLAELFSSALPPCPQLVKAFEAVAAMRAEDRCSHLARGFADGLVACGCPKEDELLTLFYLLAVGGEPPSRLNVEIPITLDPDAPSREGRTWGDIVGGMQPADFEAFWVTR